MTTAATPATTPATNPDPARTLHTRRTLPFSREQVFAAFNDPARLPLWWGPAGFTNEVESCDLRVGGVWRFTMVGPDGARYPNQCTFVTIDAPSRFVLRHDDAPLFDARFELADAGPGQTMLDWWQVFDDPAVCAQLRPMCEVANEQNLDRLEAHLRSR